MKMMALAFVVVVLIVRRRLRQRGGDHYAPVVYDSDAQEPEAVGPMEMRISHLRARFSVHAAAPCSSVVRVKQRAI